MWAFAEGCMKTYLLLKEKVERFKEDPDIKAALEAYRVRDERLEALGRFSPENAEALKAEAFDLPALRTRGPGLERLDQLTVELLLGAR